MGYLDILTEGPKWKERFELERKTRKAAEELLETKSLELYHARQLLEDKLRELTQANAALHEAHEEINAQMAQIEEMNQALTQNMSMVERINEELTDSLHYARRLQTSLAPSARRFQEIFTDAFILYQPKAIISGDFYWFCEKEQYVYFAACDCTGHGVPGAMLSVLGGNLLSQIVNENHAPSTESILQKLDASFNNALQQEGHESRSQDGMDVALCRFDKNQNKIEFSGAKRNLLLLHDGKLEEIKGDRVSIGGSDGESTKEFTRKELTLEKGDSVSIFTDGLTDQFGQETGRKFTAKKLYDILEQNALTPMQRLSSIIQQELSSWRGDVAQTDDILIMGLRA